MDTQSRSTKSRTVPVMVLCTLIYSLTTRRLCQTPCTRIKIKLIVYLLAACYPGLITTAEEAITCTAGQRSETHISYKILTVFFKFILDCSVTNKVDGRCSYIYDLLILGVPNQNTIWLMFGSYFLLRYLRWIIFFSLPQKTSKPSNQDVCSTSNTAVPWPGHTAAYRRVLKWSVQIPFALISLQTKHASNNTRH